MKIEVFTQGLVNIGIQSIIGIPDSTLKQFCDYMNTKNKEDFEHIVPANEGAAVGIATGIYLATGKPACVYMQNSGVGNIVNPLTSIVNEDVYGIPMLFVVGWRGEPGIHDEPQHKFMGKITEKIFDVIEVEYSVIDKETTKEEYEEVLKKAEGFLQAGKQYAVIVKKETFKSEEIHQYSNAYTMNRESAIETVLKRISPKDLVVSTTGKISREVYEQSNLLLGQHEQTFLTVGGMGYASMIAYGIAKHAQDRKIFCIDGDGAVLMHMGNMAFVGKHSLENFIHICLNNEAHESVGGMPTGASGMKYMDVARSCGYTDAYCVENEAELEKVLENIISKTGTFFVEVLVKQESRKNLGRPKESAVENKNSFMKYQEEH